MTPASTTNHTNHTNHTNLHKENRIVASESSPVSPDITYDYINNQLQSHPNDAVSIHTAPSEYFILGVRRGKETMINTISPHYAYLSTPQSHSKRMKLGLTRFSPEHGCYVGVVLRVAMGEYAWFPDMQMPFKDTIRTDNPNLKDRNRRAWRFVNPVSGEITERKFVSSDDSDDSNSHSIPASTISTPPAVASVMSQPTPDTAYTILFIDGDRIGLQGNGELILATVTDRFNVNNGR